MNTCPTCGKANPTSFCTKCKKYLDELIDEDLTVAIDENLFVSQSTDY